MNFKAVMPIPGFDTVCDPALGPIDDNFFRPEKSDGKIPSVTTIEVDALRKSRLFDLRGNIVEKPKLKNVGYKPTDPLKAFFKAVESAS